MHLHRNHKMKLTRTNQCIEVLAAAIEPVSDAQLVEATGLSAEYVRRLRANPEFIAEVNRQAKQRFLSQMPAVLTALAEAAADGKNASAMKLFLDACRGFESGDSNPNALDPAELLQRAHDAGIDQ